jgi:hypothetical protein
MLIHDRPFEPGDDVEDEIDYDTWMNEQEYGQLQQARIGRQPGLRYRRRKKEHHPSNDQARFSVKDLTVLWAPMSRSLIYKLFQLEANLVRLLRPAIDTTKRSKRRYTTFWIPREVKEKMEAKLGLPVGGGKRAA